MSLHGDLLRQAEQLARHEPRKPRQATLRRSVSTAYYALFHLLIDEATHRLVSGNDRKGLRRCLSRAFVHEEMKEAAKGFTNQNLAANLAPALSRSPIPAGLTRVAETSIDWQEARHQADYDTGRLFTRREVLAHLNQTNSAFHDWRSVRGELAADVFLVALLAQRRMRR